MSLRLYNGICSVVLASDPHNVLALRNLILMGTEQFGTLHSARVEDALLRRNNCALPLSPTYSPDPAKIGGPPEMGLRTVSTAIPRLRQLIQSS